MSTARTTHDLSSLSQSERINPKMASLPLQLTTIPSELLLKLYGVLSSFNDALNLRATCHILHDVWTTHRNAITNELVVKQLECYQHARQFLTDQYHSTNKRRIIREIRKTRRKNGTLDEFDSISPELITSQQEASNQGVPSSNQSELSDRDLLHLERNLRRIEKLIWHIEQKLIPNLDGISSNH
jgi:hypothetical protein